MTDEQDYYQRKADEHEAEDEKHRVYITGDTAFLEVAVEPATWEGKLYPESQLEIDEGDHLRVDEQGYDYEED